MELAKPLSISENLWQSGEVLTDWRRGNQTPISKKGEKGKPAELQVSQSHFCAQPNHGADLSGNYAKEHGK